MKFFGIQRPAASLPFSIRAKLFSLIGLLTLILAFSSFYLQSVLNEKSAEALQKTIGMHPIPAFFILGFLLAVFIVLAVNHLLEEVSAGIDKIKQTETMLSHAQRMEMIGRMSGGIAHDFNNMLIVISGNLELIERRIGDNQELKEMIASALASVDKGKELTQRILVFSRKQILKPEIININNLIPDIVELIRRAVREDVAIETDLADDLWSINIDPAQFENAILNLAVNSRDAIQGSDGKITITARNTIVEKTEKSSGSSIEPGSYVQISVQDNGTGIPADIINRVFDPFFTTKKPGKDTGLGLSMVYGFTRQSGGNILIDSTPGKGTVINLLFPKVLHIASS